MSFPDFFKLCPEWTDFFYDHDNESLVSSILEDIKTDSPDTIFRCFELTPFDNVSVVMIGKHPNSTGLSYEIKRGHVLSPDIQQMYKELEDQGYYPTKDGILEPWAKQGILLLNTSMTSSDDDAWEPFIHRVLEKLSEKKYIIWVIENDFPYISYLTNSDHLILKQKTKNMFKTINHELYKRGIEKISW